MNDLILFLKRTPFLRILAAFITGILCCWYFQLSNAFVGIWAGVSLAGVMAIQLLPSYGLYQLKWVQGILVLLFVACLGIFITNYRNITLRDNWVGHSHNYNAIVATVTEAPIEKDNSYQVKVSLQNIYTGSRYSNVRGNAILYMQKSETAQKLQYGDIIGFRKALQPVKNSGNPHSFDYQRYALFNGITHTVYLRSNEWLKIRESDRVSFGSVIHKSRSWVLQTIEKYIKDSSTVGLAEALLIGYRNNIDDDLYQSYTNTGVVHVIAVSGMHLALLFWVIEKLLKPLKSRNRWLYGILVLFIIWFFTFITGSAASIVRAATMFSVIIAGETLSRRSNVYNTLAASAFLLLCYNPYWVWDVGFQLSYAAVLSIVIFYKPVEKLWVPRNRVAAVLWQLVAVSLAAQVLTTPLVIYYFHQFPVYFLLANLLAVPLSNCLLIALLLLLPLSLIPWLATHAGYIISEAINFLNKGIRWIEQLPMAIWQGLQVSVVQVILLYLAIAALSFFIFYRWKRGIYLSLVLLLSVGIIRHVDIYNKRMECKLIVYNVSKNKAIDFIEAGKYFSVTDTAITAKNLQYNILPARIANRVSGSKGLPSLSMNKNLWQFGDKRLAIINFPVKKNLFLKQQLAVDMVVLSGNHTIYVKELVKIVQPKIVVADGAAPAWRKRYWKADCDSLGITFHDVSVSGAFVMPIP